MERYYKSRISENKDHFFTIARKRWGNDDKQWGDAGTTVLNSYFASLFAKGKHGPWKWGGNSQVPEFRGRARRLEKN